MSLPATFFPSVGWLRHLYLVVASHSEKMAYYASQTGVREGESFIFMLNQVYTSYSYKVASQLLRNIVCAHKMKIHIMQSIQYTLS